MTTSAPPPTSSAPGAAPAVSKGFLILAVVLGVVATVLAFGFIETTAGQDRGPKLTIVVAKRDLRPNATIDPEKDLVAEEIPAKFSQLAQQSLSWDARANYKGQRVNRRIPAGQPIFLADLAAVGELTLGEGKRALTIPAETGIIIPGDYVKVIVARPDTIAAAALAAQADSGEAAAPTAPGGRGRPAGRFIPPPNQVTLIGEENGYRVLAVGGSLSKTRQQVTAADPYESAGGARTVTLEVTEAQAQEIMKALGGGGGSQRASLLMCLPREKAATQPVESNNP